MVSYRTDNSNFPEVYNGKYLPWVLNRGINVGLKQINASKCYIDLI